MKCYNLSYEKVKIDTPPSETIIYLDPPYKGTVVDGYSSKKNDTGIFDYEVLYSYCHKLAQKGYKVYMSEYSCDSPFAEEIWSREKRNNFSLDKSVVKNIERLYLWH